MIKYMDKLIQMEMTPEILKEQIERIEGVPEDLLNSIFNDRLPHGTC